MLACRLMLASLMLSATVSAGSETHSRLVRKEVAALSAEHAPRQIYLDLGANWANTLRLFHDVDGHHKGPWEVFAFEASPLIQPYVEKFVAYLNGAGPKPDLTVPPTGSSQDLQKYAAKYGCPENPPDTMRECMFQVFKEPLAHLRSDPQLADSSLIQSRLAMAQQELEPNSGDRFVHIPAAAGAEDGTLTLHDVNAVQMIRGGAGSTDAHTKHDTKVQMAMVDVASWIGANFRPQDHVVVKMDIEGAEFSIFDKMESHGWMNLIDVLALECHHWAGDCNQLMTKLHGHKDMKILQEEVGYHGCDSFSTPEQYYPDDPRGLL